MPEEQALAAESVELAVAGAIRLAHTALAQFGQDPIRPERLADHRHGAKDSRDAMSR